MYNLLSALGHKNSNKDLSDLLSLEEINLDELNPLSIESLYQTMENNHYDFLILRDSVIKISLNVASISQRVLKINNTIKIILILDKEYDDFIYQKLKTLDVVVLHETNISKIKDIIVQYKQMYLDDNKTEDYDMEDDFIFDLTADKEIEIIKEDEKDEADSTLIESDNLDDVINKKTIFPLEHIKKHKQVYVFLNMHGQETQLAMQFAKTFPPNRNIVYLEFDKRNEVIFRDLHSMNLTTIMLDRENSLDMVLKVINEFKQSGNILIINTFYIAELLLLAPLVELHIEAMQSKYHIEKLMGDASIHSPNKKYDIFLGYYTEGLPNVDYMSKIYTGIYHPIFNSRLSEYIARQNNKLTTEGED